jgi:hypothetical protein
MTEKKCVGYEKCPTYQLMRKWIEKFNESKCPLLENGECSR